MLHYDAESKTVQAYDGRETASAAATENYLRGGGALTPRAPSSRCEGIPTMIQVVGAKGGT